MRYSFINCLFIIWHRFLWKFSITLLIVCTGQKSHQEDDAHNQGKSVKSEKKIYMTCICLKDKIVMWILLQQLELMIWLFQWNFPWDSQFGAFLNAEFLFFHQKFKMSPLPNQKDKFSIYTTGSDTSTSVLQCEKLNFTFSDFIQMILERYVNQKFFPENVTMELCTFQVAFNVLQRDQNRSRKKSKPNKIKKTHSYSHFLLSSYQVLPVLFFSF